MVEHPLSRGPKPLFEAYFVDPDTLSRDWIPAPGMSVQSGVLTFAPRDHEGFCVGVTQRNDFRDFALTADVRILRSTVGLVLRAEGPGQYYMVQFDLANNDAVVWFHTFTPSAERGYRLELVPSAHVPRPGEWHQMRVVVNGPAFDVLLGDSGGPLRHCASWVDPLETYKQGAVGVWEHGGEAGEYRAFRVDPPSVT